jgi:hypothetical protein
MQFEDDDDGGPGPSLAVRLMQVAGEFELERKRERQDLEGRVSRLRVLNGELEERAVVSEQRVELLNQRLSQTRLELETLSTTQDEQLEAYRRQVVGLRFLLGERTLALRYGNGRHSHSSENSEPIEVQESAKVCVCAAQDALVSHGNMLAIAESAAEVVFSAAGLCAAAEAGADAVVRSILSPDPVSSMGDETMVATFTKALYRAASRGHVDIARALLNVGAEPLAVLEGDDLARTAVHWAAISGSEEMMQVLSEVEGVAAALDEGDTLRDTPLILAAAHDCATTVKFLLLNGANPKACNEAGQCAEAAAEAAHAESALRMLREPNLVFWNSSVRANRLYNEKLFDDAIAAYSCALDIAPKCSMVSL